MKKAICPDAVWKVKRDIVGSEKTSRGIWGGIDTTLVNRKTKTKLWMPDYLAGVRQDGGAVPGWRCCIWPRHPAASCFPIHSVSAPTLLHAVKKRNLWHFLRGVIMLQELLREMTFNTVTCNFLNRSPCVLLFPCFPCFAFQNCFWAEYLLMGHTLKRQSR